MEMRSVYSSHVESIGYDEATQTLVVEWASGKTSAYSGVLPDIADQVLSAPSIGTALRQLVRGAYVHKYV